MFLQTSKLEKIYDFYIARIFINKLGIFSEVEIFLKFIEAKDQRKIL